MPPSGRSADAVWHDIQEHHPYPMSLQVVLTNRCELHCPHCYVIPTDDTDTLSLSTYERCFEEWADLGVFLLTFTGGEPGLRGDLLPIIAAAGRRHYLIHLKTAAVWMSADDPRRLSEAGLSVLEISLYSPDAAAHDGFVGKKGAFERSFAAAEGFRAVGGRVRINIAAMSWNAEQVPALVRLCEEAGFDTMVDPILVVRQDKDAAPTRLRMSEEQLFEMMAAPSVNDRSLLAALPEKSPDANVCGAGRGSAQIEPNGDVRLCDKLRAVIGNIRYRALSEIWETSELRQKMLALRWKDLPVCSSCSNARACGHCPGEALAALGDITAANPYECKVTRALLGQREHRNSPDRR